MQKFAAQFYNSTPWRQLSYTLRIQTNGICPKCHKKDIPISKMVAHHKIELNESNINDPAVALNPDLIDVECMDCHNKEHKRFGYQNEHNVYIVWGSPLSGKSTFVQENMSSGDLVLDMDLLWQALSLQDKYIKPVNMRFIIFDSFNHIKQKIKERYGGWYDAYIITSSPQESEVKRMAQELGAEIIKIDSTYEECLARANERPSDWVKYVNEWWEVNK